MGNDNCVLGVENKEKIVALENTINTDIKPQIKGLYDTVTFIKDSLLQRPSWAVTILITVLSSACVGLFVAFIRGLAK